MHLWLLAGGDDDDDDDDDDSDLYQPMDTCTYHPCGTLADTDRCRNIPSVDLMEGLHHP